MPMTMTSSKEEETLWFFQYVEDSGLRAYKSVVSGDVMWNEKSRNAQEKKEKKRKKEEVKRTGGSEEMAVEGKHLRMGSGTMEEHLQQFSVRSQSLHSVGGEEEEGSPNSRKQPPPKPRRDPATKLSTSSEAVDHSAFSCKGGHSQKWDATQGCSDECRRVPPPKPKRNPNTQLSTSFDESYILNSSLKDSPSMTHSREVEVPSPDSPLSPPQPQSPQQDSDTEEPVYIEMSGKVVQDSEEPGEAVYEEMKYPTLDDFDARWDISGYRSQSITPCPSDTDIHAYTRGTQLCDIPAPFPNLLSHRPPLLVFPSLPAQCSPISDESPITPLDASKLPTTENGSHPKSLSSSSSSMEPLSSASSSHLRRAERELMATPTITISGRSSAPPLPCTRYRSSTGSAGSQRSHSACPSPVNMGRCLTPLTLMRTPFDAPLTRQHSSAQNVAAGRSRTPTSPLDELTNLFTSGRNMLKTKASGRKSKDPAESEAKGKESKKEHKERSQHSKESKKDKERSGKHRRDSKDRELTRTEALPRCDSKDKNINTAESLTRRDSKDRGLSNVEPLVRRDSKDKSYSNGEPLARRNSKDRGHSNVEPLARRNSRDQSSSGPELLAKQGTRDQGCSTTEPILRHDSRHWVCNGMEPLPRLDSKDRICTGPELLPRKGSRDRLCSVTEPMLRYYNTDWVSNCKESLARPDSKDRICNGQELVARQGSKDRGCSVTELRHDHKDWLCNGTEPLTNRDSKERLCTGLQLIPRLGSKDRSCSVNESMLRHDSKDWMGSAVESLPKCDSKDRICNGSDVFLKQDCKDLPRNSLEQRNSKDRSSHGPELLPRHSSKDLGRTGLETRRNSKEGRKKSLDSYQGVSSTAHCGRDCKEHSSTGMDIMNRRHSKDKGVTPLELQHKSKDKSSYSIESAKAHERDIRSGHPSKMSSRPRPSPISPSTILGISEMKTVPKPGQSASTADSPLGTPQRKHSEAQEMPLIPWVYGDSTMLEVIERKQRLCREIRSRQWLPDRSPTKTEGTVGIPDCKKTSGPKKNGPPPYPSQSADFWDTAI